MKIEAIDLFCGVGGLTHGVQKSGINVIAGFDIEESCKIPYEYNNDAKFIMKDIKKLNSNEVLSLYSEDVDIKILMGCAPCQPFSSYSHRYKENEEQKNKMDLLDYFGKQVLEIKPEIVSMENVPQMEKKDVFHKFVKRLRDIGYNVEYSIVYAPDYGVPQRRKRLVLLASRIGEISLIKPIYTQDNYPTLRDTIGNLPVIKAGEVDPLDNLHRSSSLSSLNLKRIKKLETWRNLA